MVCTITYFSCECVCNIDISELGHDFHFSKADNLTKRQSASRTESVVSENDYLVNLELTGEATKCFTKQTRVTD